MPNNIIEKWIKETADEIASVDSHKINAIGPGGTIAAQIIAKQVPTLLLSALKEQREELVEKIKKSKTFNPDVNEGLSTAIEIITNQKEQ